MPTFSIQQVSTKTGLSIATLRYYEKLGLLAPSRDAQSNHRRYSETDIQWIGFLLLLRSTKMPLETIKSYGELFLQGPSTLAQRRAILATHAQTVEANVSELQVALEVIRKKMAQYKKLEKALKKG
ncbi:MAG: MerR family transcriptional regulator [Trueperaceae bacterium]